MTSVPTERARSAAAVVLVERARAGGGTGASSERLASAFGHAVDGALADACVAALAGERGDVPWALLDDDLFAAMIEAVSLLGRGDLIAAALAPEVGSKPRTKLAKKAAHRLRTRGVDVPVADAPATHATVVVRPVEDPDAERRSLITAPDGTGGRLVVVLADAPQGVVLVESIFRDDILVRIAGAVTTWKKARPMVRQLLSTSGEALASVDVSIGAAEILAADAGGRLEAPSLRDRLIELRPVLRPLARDAQRLPEPELDEDATRRRAAESGELFVLPAFASWFPERRELLDCGEKLHVAAASDLVINEAQRHDQLERVFARAAREYLTDARRHVLIARLRHASRFLSVVGEAADAERAWAAACVIEVGGVPPFVEQLFRRAFQRSAPSSAVSDPERAAEPRPRLVLPGAPDPSAGGSGGGLILP